MTGIFDSLTWKELYFCAIFLLSYTHTTHVILYNKFEDFYNNVSEKNHFVLFYTSWCGHCLRVKPSFEKLAEMYNHDDENVILAKVDCDNLLSLCTDLNIIRYPTLQFFWAGHKDVLTFKGKKNFINMFLFLERMAKAKPPFSKPVVVTTRASLQQSGPFELAPDNFESVVSSPRYNFVKFYVPWCSHCQAMSAVWRHLRGEFENSDELNIAEVNCMKYSNICESQAIQGYPSLVMFKDGKIIAEYFGERDYDMMKNYIKFIMDIEGGESKTKNQIASSEPEKIQAVEDKTEGPFGNEFDLDANNFRREIEHRVHFVLFYTTSCNFCKSIKEAWIELRKTFVNSDVVAVSQVSCLVHSILCNEEEVTYYPSIFVYFRGKKVLEYQGEKSQEKLEDYIQSFITNITSESMTDGENRPPPEANPEKDEL